MNKTYELKSQTFQNGRIVLYQRPNMKSPIWQVRVKNPGGSGFVIKSSGTTDQYEARRFADDLYDDLRAKARAGISVKGKSFAKLFEEFEVAYPNEAASPRRCDDVVRILRTYALPHFDKTKVTNIGEVEVTKFFDWRKKNGKSGKIPTNTTLIFEISALKAFLDWCYRHGHCSKRLDFARPSAGKNRRPHFGVSDMRKLFKTLRESEEDSKTTNGGRSYRDRVMLRNYVMILGSTGIRVGEARGLRWSDIDRQDEGGKQPDYLVLRVKGKTGPRDVVVLNNDLKDSLEKIWNLRCNELDGNDPPDNELIFCHKDGGAIHSFKKGFLNAIRAAGIEFDSNEQRRSIYSLRHTYATNSLEAGRSHYSIAKNMGTSVQMLERFYGHVSNKALAKELTKTRKMSIGMRPWE